MAMTAAELAYAHAQLGTDADEDDLQERVDRLGSVPDAVAEVLQQRLADLLVTPAMFAIPTEYVQQTSDNIKALQLQLSALGAGGSATGLVEPYARRPR